MDINEIVFIAVICFLLYVLIVNPFISQTKKARYNRYFRRAKNTRFPYVKNISKDPENIPNDCTVEEIIAVLALISANENVAKAYIVALHLSDSNLQEKFNEDFFTYLFATGKRFSNIRWFNESMEMLTLGIMLSKKFNKEHWLADFNDAHEYVNRLRSTGKQHQG